MKLEDFGNIPFRMQDLNSVYPGCANLATKARRLENAGEIIRLKKGLYITSSKISRVPVSPFLVANHMYGPSYISMQTALRFYGMIPETVYEIQSMTTGLTKEYSNDIGKFRYVHVSPEYYNCGVVVAEESGISFMIASPAKALCDLMVYSPYLNLKSCNAIAEYLEDDIRFDMDELASLDKDVIKRCAENSRKKTMLNQLMKFINK